MSWPVTIADDLDLIEQLAFHPDMFDRESPNVRHTRVRAPCCGRSTPADTVVSLAGLKTEIRGGNYLPLKDHDWACDGCLSILIADESNGWTWSNLYNALGAPDDVLRVYVAREATRDAEKNASKLEEWLNPQEVFEQITAHLPAQLKNDRSTQRPDKAA